MPLPPGLSQKDADQVLRAVMDDDHNRLRVDAVISPDGHDLEINHEDDSIAIGTPTELFTATDIGSKVGLDVNVINTIPLDVDISAASGDNIAIADQTGTNFLAVNPDGSINVELEGLNQFQTNQYTINTAAVRLAFPALANRSGISVKAHNTSNAIVYIGNSSGVTASTGYALFDGDSVSLDLTGTGQVWAIGSSPGQVVYVLEIGG